MASKILLCISASQAFVAHTRGRGVVRCEIFNADEEGIAAFSAFLTSLVDAAPPLVSIAADAIEEDYRYEMLPHATGSDRGGMLDRKLKQYYRNTPYVAALPRGRVGDKRRDDRYLFAALTNPALIEPWLSAITKFGLPVTGIYLVSMLTAALVRKLNVDLSRVLVVAPHQSGLRLTFYKDDEFCVSRLSRGSANQDAARTPNSLASEIANTRAYLSSLQLDFTDDPLTVLFLDRDGSLAPLVDHVAAESASLQCVRIDRETLIRQLHIAPEHLHLALEFSYLGLLADTVPEGNLAPAPVTAGHRVYQRRNALYAAAATLGLAGIMWAGYNLWLTRDLEQQAADVAKRTVAAQAQYRDITREFPVALTTSENLINAVEVYKKISKSIRSPQPFMRIVSRAIEPSPEIFLQEVNWTYGTQSQNIEGIERTPQGAAAADVSAGLVQSGYVAGEIRPFHGDYRTAIDTINGITSRLARDPAVAVARVVNYPLNVNSGLALSGNTRDAAEQMGTAGFKIVVILKPDA